MDFTLIRMLEFGEESHTPTSMTGLIFNQTGATEKRQFALYVCKEQQKQTFGKIYKILHFWMYDITISQTTPFLGILFQDYLSFFFKYLICLVIFRLLSWIPLFF